MVMEVAIGSTIRPPAALPCSDSMVQHSLGKGKFSLPDEFPSDIERRLGRYRIDPWWVATSLQGVSSSGPTSHSAGGNRMSRRSMTARAWDPPNLPPAQRPPCPAAPV